MFYLLTLVISLLFTVRNAMRRIRKYINDHANNLSRYVKKGHDNVLLVTAHPDDESMFFIPTIQTLKHLKIPIHILCLSNGNADGSGEIRRGELSQSCSALGVTFTLIEDEHLPDGPEKWDPIDVSRVLESFISKEKVKYNTLLTFDRHGISSHPNHISLSDGVRHFASTTSLREFTIMELETVPLLLKYSFGWLTIIPDFVQLIIEDYYGGFFRSADGSKKVLTIIDFREYLWKGVRSMMKHRSQLVWYRVLYILFSRYMHTNTLVIRKPIK